MSEIGIQSVLSQEAESAPRPVLLPSPGLGAWLEEMGGSIVFTTYQNSRVFFLSGDGQGGTVAQERIVGSAMGLAVDNDKLWITNKEQAWRFVNVGPRTIKNAEDDTETAFDAVFMPRFGVFLGPCDTHDVLTNIEHAGERHELLFVNTAFSCVSSIDAHYNFVPQWKPPFISAIGPGDRCHLNGMGARDGKLAFATACAVTDTAGAWRERKAGGGVLIDVQQNAVIAEGFSMPHSPRWHEGRLWVLDSGVGDFGFVDPASGAFERVALCPGFARGMTIVGNCAVIGLSQLRPNTFSSGLPIKERLESLRVAQRCGLLIIDLTTGKTLHWLTIQGISELYDTAFLSGIRRPYTPGFSEPERHRQWLNIPDSAAFPTDFRTPTQAAADQSAPGASL